MKKPKLLAQFFALAVIEGMISFIILFSLPADPQTAWLFKYSQSRVFMLGVTLLGILVFGWLMLKSMRDSVWVARVMQRVNSLFEREKLAVVILSFLLFVLLLGIIYLFSTYTQTDYLIRPRLLVATELIRTYMDRLAPLVLWATALSLQTLIALTILGYGTKKHYYKVVRILSITIFPLLLVVIWFTIQVDDDYYYFINKEDQLVEWFTFAFLMIAGLLSLQKSFMARKAGSRYFWFYVLFGIACLVFGMEEISWGQRIFAIESSDFFMANSDQQEINVHNVVNLWFDVRTKHIAALALFVFGVGLPVVALNLKMKTLFEKMCIVVPPLFLSLGFALGAFLTLDIFSGKEEEIAEFFLSLSLLLFIILENLKPNGSPNTQTGHDI